MRSVRFSAALGASLCGVLTAATAVQASSLEGLHKQVQIGNKICMVGHVHYGQTAGWATRALAETDAARSWSGFTGFEYGAAWADFRLAEQQNMACQETASDRGGTVWSCASKAVPCKLAPPNLAQSGQPTYVATPPSARPVDRPTPRAVAAPVQRVVRAASLVPVSPTRVPRQPYCRPDRAGHGAAPHPGHGGLGHGRPQVWPGDAR